MYATMEVWIAFSDELHGVIEREDAPEDQAVAGGIGPGRWRTWPTTGPELRKAIQLHAPGARVAIPGFREARGEMERRTRRA